MKPRSDLLPGARAGAGDVVELARRLRQRSRLSRGLLARVEGILTEVRRRGDVALIQYTRAYDGVELTPTRLRVSPREIASALDQIPSRVRRALQRLRSSIARVELVRLRRLAFSVRRSPGVQITFAPRPVPSVGCYIPGGQARYPSTVLMAAVPAKVAGVRRIILCTPPVIDGSIPAPVLAAAAIAGVDGVYRVGGAQAIAAMAFGTDRIPAVSKIVGPGNRYVTAAKRLVAGEVPVDGPAGPTELAVVADKSADAELLAADLLAQAEHAPDTLCGLVTDSEHLVDQVRHQVVRQLRDAPRRDIIVKALRRGYAITVPEMNAAIAFINALAPEHVQLFVSDPAMIAPAIVNAGVILLGATTPSAAADYGLGPNHILPTDGAATWRTGLSSLDFVKIIPTVTCSSEGLQRLAWLIESLTDVEGLPNHRRAVEVRLR